MRVTSSLLLLLAASPASAAPLTYLVNAIDHKAELPAPLGQAVTNRICADLAASDKQAQVLCPDDARALLQAQGDLLALGVDSGPAAGAMDANAALRLKADRGISGSLAKLGQQLVLSLTLFDYQSGRPIGRASVTAGADDLAALLAKIPAALTQLHQPPKAP